MILRVGGGKVTCVYNDRLHATFQRIGVVSIRRASAVEYDHDKGGWMVDLSPTIRGCVLGPFPSRADALLNEQERLEQELRRP